MAVTAWSLLSLLVRQSQYSESYINEQVTCHIRSEFDSPAAGLFDDGNGHDGIRPKHVPGQCR